MSIAYTIGSPLWKPDNERESVRGRRMSDSRSVRSRAPSTNNNNYSRGPSRAPSVGRASMMGESDIADSWRAMSFNNGSGGIFQNRDPFGSGNPFRTPSGSIRSQAGPLSSRALSLQSIKPERPRKRVKSSRLVGEYEQPWLINGGKKGPNWDSLIFYSAAAIGVALSAYFCLEAVRKVPKNDYCLVMEDHFKTLDTDIWNHEIQLNGFGTGSFDWTTDDPQNSYVDAQGLHIVPTLTLQSTNITYAQFTNGYTVDLIEDGTCTSLDQRVSGLTSFSPCEKTSKLSTLDILNPVRSARLTTAGKATIRYGRVEVIAKMPKGDWLWPAIWMMPQDSIYGAWPRSGEIDIAESRGNDAQTYALGNNIIGSALHWGTSYDNDAYYLTRGEWGAKRTQYSDDYHTFGLEWSQKYLFMWLDGRLRQVFFIDFSTVKNLWKFGGFATQTTKNGTAPDNPWVNSTSINAPFDQEFYLILNVAVGGTNGYFPDLAGGKPWLDNSKNAMRDFWKANQTWLQTWGKGADRGMTVKSVKMWQEGKCDTAAASPSTVVFS